MDESINTWKPWKYGESMSANLGIPRRDDLLLALMPMKVGQRAGVTIFIGANCDWKHRHFQRHGGVWLATLPGTLQIADYRDRYMTRAGRLTYTGKKPSDMVGMVEDLVDWGYDLDQLSTFLVKSKPYMPIGSRWPDGFSPD